MISSAGLQPRNVCGAAAGAPTETVQDPLLLMPAGVLAHLRGFDSCVHSFYCSPAALRGSPARP